MKPSASKSTARQGTEVRSSFHLGEGIKVIRDSEGNWQWQGPLIVLEDAVTFDGDNGLYSLEVEYDIEVNHSDKRVIVDLIELIPNTLWRALRIAGQTYDELLDTIKKYADPDEVSWSKLTIGENGAVNATAIVHNKELTLQWNRPLPYKISGITFGVVIPALASNGYIAIYHQESNEIFVVYYAHLRDGTVRVDFTYRTDYHHDLNASKRFLYVIALRHTFWLDQWIINRIMKRTYGS
jgi:hypothetical protein